MTSCDDSIAIASSEAKISTSWAAISETIFISVAAFRSKLLPYPGHIRNGPDGMCAVVDVTEPCALFRFNGAKRETILRCTPKPCEKNGAGSKWPRRVGQHTCCKMSTRRNTAWKSVAESFSQLPSNLLTSLI